MIYDYVVKKADGTDLNLSDLKGKVVMVVNTATSWGFTPQYAQFEQMYQNYHNQGFEILDFPCNQFGGQAPGTAEEIRDFCKNRFHTTFEPMKKIDVNGENAIPLFTYLKEQKGFEGFPSGSDRMEKMLAKIDPDWDKNSDIKWNFTKFIIDRDGNVVARFEPMINFEKVEECVKSLL